MTPSELLARLRSPEDGFCERKPGTVNQREIRRTLVAFANSVPEGRIAVLVVGIHDNGSVLGVEDSDALQKRVRQAAEQECYPPIRITCEVILIDGKVVVTVEVPYSHRRPHFAGPAYVRRGSESVVATEELYEDLINSRTDKCRSILVWKESGKFVTVQCVGRQLGGLHTKLHPESVWPGEVRECRVLACDSHVVTLEIVGSMRRVTEPLEYVTVGYDDAKWRMMLIVRDSR